MVSNPIPEAQDTILVEVYDALKFNTMVIEHHLVSWIRFFPFQLVFFHYLTIRLIHLALQLLALRFQSCLWKRALTANLSRTKWEVLSHT